MVNFSKFYCPFCQRAKKAVHEIGVAPVVVELDERPDGRAMQIAFMQMTGERTVPNVWLNGKHIGGSDDTVAAIRNGPFQNLDKTAAKDSRSTLASRIARRLMIVRLVSVKRLTVRVELVDKKKQRSLSKPS